MKCPVGDTALRETDRYGIRVDICATCKVIWLDRGELEKIIAATEQEFVPPFDSVPSDPPPSPNPEQDRFSRREGPRETRYGERPKRRKSILSELFEMLDD